MHILIAPDSYKESLTALEVAQTIEKGFKEIFPYATYTLLPVADGGEGTVTSIIDATDGQYITKEVTDPLGNPIKATYGITGNGETAIIEMSAASGLMHVPKNSRNPYYTTSYGTGELIVDALEQGVAHIILGIGGSATNDGGAGMLQALGVRLLDQNDVDIEFGGLALNTLHHIDLSNIHPKISNCRFDIACDVDNPLIGERGASAVFGPQKGASPEMVTILDQALQHYGNKILESVNIDVKYIKGAGAAGGMGAACLAFLRGKLEPGINIVMKTVKLHEAVQKADLVITGEGRIDGQTIFGKTPIGVARVAKQFDAPVIAIAGCLGDGSELTLDEGIDAVFSITNAPMTLEEAYEKTPKNLQTTARNIAAIYKMNQRY